MHMVSIYRHWQIDLFVQIQSFQLFVISQENVQYTWSNISVVLFK